MAIPTSNKIQRPSRTEANPGNRPVLIHKSPGPQIQPAADTGASSQAAVEISGSSSEAPVSTTISTVSENTGLQITVPQRYVLEHELGYHRNEVDDMHPEVKKSN